MDIRTETRERFKGALWFEKAKEFTATIGGMGGIGSWLALFIARIGTNLYIFDHDTYETHNLGGQFVSSNKVLENKALATKELLREFGCGDSSINVFGKFEEDTGCTPLVFACFDNMEARKWMYNSWNKRYCTNPAALFVDARLLAQQYQIICIRGEDNEAMRVYAQKFMFLDSEVTAEDCTFKQTSHCAAGVAGKMAGYYTNHLANLVTGVDVFPVPFFTEYHTESNYFKSVSYEEVDSQE